MTEEERRERHRQNYMHVATHTAQVREGSSFESWEFLIMDLRLCGTVLFHHAVLGAGLRCGHFC